MTNHTDYDAWLADLERQHWQQIEAQEADAETQQYINEHGDYPPDHWAASQLPLAAPLSIDGEGSGVRFSHPATRPDDGRHRRTRPAPARAVSITPAGQDYLRTYAPILMHDAFNLRLAAGDEKAVALKKACDRWQTLRDAAYRTYCKQAAPPHFTRARFHDLNDELGTLCRAGEHNSPRAAELRRLLAWPKTE